MVKIPTIIRKFFPSVFWKGNDNEQVVYFTFDDGPTPKVTAEVLRLLKVYDGLATFFCLGNRVEKFPAIYSQIVNEGHSVGNHSYSHPLGWNTTTKKYIDDVELASQFIQSKLFRPPYGKMKWSQYHQLKIAYKVVLWDIIPGDYRKSMTVSKLVHNVLNNVSNGSVIVLHDSEKCANVMLAALPIILKELNSKGYVFKAI